jgi:hypothetical protein
LRGDIYIYIYIQIYMNMYLYTYTVQYKKNNIRMEHVSMTLEATVNLNDLPSKDIQQWRSYRIQKTSSLLILCYRSNRADRIFDGVAQRIFNKF